MIARLVEEGRYDEIFTASRGIRVFVPKTDPFGDELDVEGEDEHAVTLGEVCPRVKSKLTYEYDFGDGWEHIIEVQKIVEPTPGESYPVCLAGRKVCPPEDCGGVPGYCHLLEIIADPDHEEHEVMVEWLVRVSILMRSTWMRSMTCCVGDASLPADEHESQGNSGSTRCGV